MFFFERLINFPCVDLLKWLRFIEGGEIERVCEKRAAYVLSWRAKSKIQMGAWCGASKWAKSGVRSVVVVDQITVLRINKSFPVRLRIQNIHKMIMMMVTKGRMLGDDQCSSNCAAAAAPQVKISDVCVYVCICVVVC